jgi:RNA polymerase sigma-70 factor (ECF subfamily)
MFHRLHLVTSPAGDREAPRRGCSAGSPAEAVFLERYGRLYRRALQLTRDPEQAEDLVQDAFVQFVLARTPLESIGNLDAYLSAMLQHMHVSQVRRAARARQTSLEAFEHDSAEFALRGSDAASRLQTAEQLGLICQFACQRSAASRVGSVLLLRFFHGYYVREIAAILMTGTANVDGMLHIARREARAYLEDPARQAAFEGTPKGLTGSSVGDPSSATRDGCLADLRRSIFASAHANCFPAAWFASTYGRASDGVPSCAAIRALVTCPTCLDAVNEILGLPLLAERFPTDSLGQDRRSGPGPSGHDGGPAGPTARRLRRRLTDVTEHRPSQLSVTVNGILVATQRVGGARSEQAVRIGVAEPIGFVEVFSEQNVRLLYMPVDPMPDGAVEQAAQCDFGEGRSVEVRLDSSEASPMLHVTYCEPHGQCAAVPDAAQDREVALLPARPAERPAGRAQDHARWPWARLAGRWLRAAAKWGLRPGAIPATAVLVLLALVGWFWMRGTPTVSAVELLDRAAAIESADSRNGSALQHRVLDLEELNEAGRLARTTRVETWRDPVSRSTARRAFDRTGALTALEIVEGGTRGTIFRPDAAPESSSPEGRGPIGDVLEAGQAWRIDLSVREFVRIAGTLSEPRLEETPSTYVISCEGRQQAATGIVRATLTLTRPGLRPVAQVLFVREARGIRVYHLAEQRAERVPAATAGDKVFSPDPGLILARPAPSASPRVVAPPAGRALDANDLSALEVDALFLLNEVKATLGEQVSVTHDASGVRIEAIVGTTARKREILAALSPLAGRPEVVIDVRTVSEAAGRQARVPRPVVVKGAEQAGERTPAYADVRRYLEAHADPAWPSGGSEREERLEREVLLFGAQALERSHRILEHAWALEHLVEQVAPERVAQLAPSARDRWWAMLHEHAGIVREETSALRLSLAAVFAPGARATSHQRQGSPPAAATDVAAGVRQLLAGAQAQDEAVRSAFTVVAGKAGEPLQVATAAFWDNIARVETLAGSMVDAR